MPYLLMKFTNAATIGSEKSEWLIM